MKRKFHFRVWTDEARIPELAPEVLNQEEAIQAQYRKAQGRNKPFEVWQDTSDLLTWEQLRSGL